MTPFVILSLVASAFAAPQVNLKNLIFYIYHLSIIINSTLRGTSGKLHQKMIIDQNPIQVALTNITILL